MLDSIYHMTLINFIAWCYRAFSPGAEFRPHSQSKIATIFPNTMSDFPN